ncbi:MAG TPA: GNAT family N-acetyltransferase [Telluria sp.]|nr:GNAT family N-acetyltransferase [Telluria sp.]
MSTRGIIIRDYRRSDEGAVNALAVKAFEQYQSMYEDWPGFRARLENMSTIAESGELVVAEVDGTLAGAVGYIAPFRPKADYFEPEWPIMRMLVVDPAMRGRGVGRTLARECLARARRDGATEFALHTSPIMEVALPMYLRMGFRRRRSAPLIHGVDYDVYVLSLTSEGMVREDYPPVSLFSMRGRDKA